MLRPRTHLRPKRESSKTSVAIVIVIIPFFYKLRYFNFDLVGIDPRAKGGQRREWFRNGPMQMSVRRLGRRNRPSLGLTAFSEQRRLQVHLKFGPLEDKVPR